MPTEGSGRQLYAALDAQDWARVEALASPDLVVQVGSAPPIDIHQWRRNQQAFYAGFPDGHHVIDSCLIAADHVITRCRFQGTHTGPFAGTAPTGRTVSVGVIHIDRYVDDRLVEHHGQLDMLGLFRQIGAA